MASKKLREDEVKMRLYVRWGNAENGYPAPSLDMSVETTLGSAEEQARWLFDAVREFMSERWADGQSNGHTEDANITSLFAAR